MILTLTMNKGGTGKTTLTINLAAALTTFHKKKVLLIDLDPQASLTVGMGIYDLGENDTSYELLTGDVDFNTAIHKYSDRIHIIPSSLNLASISLGGEKLELTRLKYALQPLVDQYDYIFCDVNPGISQIKAAVFFAIDQYLMPVNADVASYKGTINSEYLMKQFRPDLKPAGVIFNRLNPRRIYDRDLLHVYGQEYDVFLHFLRQDIKLSESFGMGKHIYDYAPNSNAAMDMQGIAKEFIRKMKKL